jgi:hypothetical protein
VVLERRSRALRKRLSLIFALTLLMTLALPAMAITRGGELDGNEHPYVGLMVAYDHIDLDEDPETPDVLWPIWRCSGALISPTEYVTAGHCVGEDPVTGWEPEFVNIWFESDLEPILASTGYPFGGAPGTVVRGGGTSVGGTPEAHPLYVPEAFFLYDLGKVVLDAPVASAQYAMPPSPAQVDEYAAENKGRRSAVVTAVGYGLQASSANPLTGPGDKHEDKVQADRTRYNAELFIVDTKGVAGIGGIKLPSELPPTNSMILSGDAKHGGTCFGDSGGPILIKDGSTDYLVGVTSFGLNLNCGGIGGAFRVDRPLEIGFMTGS